MKKFVYLAAVAVLALGACSKNEILYTETEVDPVLFGAYSGRVQTKAGPTDDMNLDALKAHGFGVFATYTGTNAFEDADNDKGATDDFMYNQLVTYASTAWTYTEPYQRPDCYCAEDQLLRLCSLCRSRGDFPCC